MAKEQKKHNDKDADSEGKESVDKTGAEKYSLTKKGLEDKVDKINNESKESISQRKTNDTK